MTRSRAVRIPIAGDHAVAWAYGSLPMLLRRSVETVPVMGAVLRQPGRGRREKRRDVCDPAYPAVATAPAGRAVARRKAIGLIVVNVLSSVRPPLGLRRRDDSIAVSDRRPAPGLGRAGSRPGRPCAEADRVACGQARLSAAASMAARASASSGGRCWGQAATRAGRAGRDPLVLSTSSGGSGAGGRGSPRSRSNRLGGRERTRAAPSRGSGRGSSRVGRMRERPWPSTKSSSPPRSCPSTTSRSAAPARRSETTASTAIPSRRSRSVWPVGTKTDLRPRRASRSSSSATVFLPIAQSSRP
jgi:hypothetical protein